MQFYVIALAVIGVVAADVSHLHLGHADDYSHNIGIASPYASLSASASASSSSSSSGHADDYSHNIGIASPYASLSASDSASSSSSSSGQHAIPGGDSSSYQPEHLIPQHLKAAHVESASAEINFGEDSRSYQPEHLIPQHLKAAHVESASAGINFGEDSSSYQPAHLIPQHLQATQSTTSHSYNLGADTQTPEQFIPEADRIAHNNYIQAQTQTVISGGDQAASAQVIPGGDASSYQPEHLIPQKSFNLGADTQTPEQFIPEADRVAHAQYVQEQEQEQSPVVIGANTITPAHLYQEPVSNGIEEFHAETHVPVVIGRDTVTPAHLLPKYSVGASVVHDTQYGSNGGYVY
ncbi:hypothetical protein ACLKA7_006356 [Drosophila subpalustris]